LERGKRKAPQKAAGRRFCLRAERDELIKKNKTTEEHNGKATFICWRKKTGGRRRRNRK